MEWHLTRSDAFRDMLVEPLRDRVKIELTDIKYWREDLTVPQIFCQVALPRSLMDNPKAKVVWLPMWDNVWDYPQEWWDNLPKHIRVVSFSSAVHEKVKNAHLPTIKLNYFKNPTEFEPVEWKTKRLFYWNRVGLIGPAFVNKLCKATHADELIFMSTIDPGIPDNCYYELPDRIGSTKIITVKQTNRRDFFELTKSSNLFLAPRTLEGVGMTFLEAMARGSALFAYDAPTMNEYIKREVNGYIFRSTPSRHPLRRGVRLARRLAGVTPPPYKLSTNQEWSKISKLNFEKIGDQARQDHRIGYASWQLSLDDYAKFLTNW